MIEEPQISPTSRKRNAALQYQFINRCRGCQANVDALEPVLTMSPMPLAGLFCDTQEEAENAPRFPLTWLYCRRCGLVQVGEDVADCDLFEKYHYASSSVPTLVRHFENYAAALAARYGESSPIQLLEIGCNDGVLLRKLPTSWKLTGVDPSDVARNAAALNGERYDLASRAFTPTLVEEMRWTESCDIVTGSNFEEAFGKTARGLCESPPNQRRPRTNKSPETRPPHRRLWRFRQSQRLPQPNARAAFFLYRRRRAIAEKSLPPRRRNDHPRPFSSAQRSARQSANHRLELPGRHCEKKRPFSRPMAHCLSNNLISTTECAFVY